jgi:hypothetical protein
LELTWQALLKSIFHTKLDIVSFDLKNSNYLTGQVRRRRRYFGSAAGGLGQKQQSLHDNKYYSLYRYFNSDSMNSQ